MIWRRCAIALQMFLPIWRCTNIKIIPTFTESTSNECGENKNSNIEMLRNFFFHRNFNDDPKSNQCLCFLFWLPAYLKFELKFSILFSTTTYIKDIQFIFHFFFQSPSSILVFEFIFTLQNVWWNPVAILARVDCSQFPALVAIPTMFTLSNIFQNSYTKI